MPIAAEETMKDLMVQLEATMALADKQRLITADSASISRYNEYDSSGLPFDYPFDAKLIWQMQAKSFIRTICKHV
jgi:hypothetical protein